MWLRSCIFRKSSAARPLASSHCSATKAAASARRSARSIVDRREQFHTLRLNESLDTFNPSINSLLTQGQDFFMQQTGDPVASRQLTIGSLEQLRDQQALSLAYFDVYFVSAALAFGLVFLLLLMRRSVAEKGAHIAAD